MWRGPSAGIRVRDHTLLEVGHAKIYAKIMRIQVSFPSCLNRFSVFVNVP